MNIKCYVRETDLCGWGVFSSERKIIKGQFIGAYQGRWFVDGEKERKDDEYIFESNLTIKDRVKEDDKDIFIDKECQILVDSRMEGNVTRLINGSCEPNLQAFYINIYGDEYPLIGFFAREEISEHSELTIDYGEKFWKTRYQQTKQPCLCGSERCKYQEKDLIDRRKKNVKKMTLMEMMNTSVDSMGDPVMESSSDLSQVDTTNTDSEYMPERELYRKVHAKTARKTVRNKR